MESMESADVPGEGASERLQRLIHLYEGTINFLVRGTEAAEQGRLGDFSDDLKKAREVIETFKRTLDFKQGGEVAQQLNDLYDFMLDSLSEAEKAVDIQLTRRIIKILRDLLDGWRGAQPQIASEAQL